MKLKSPKPDTNFWIVIGTLTFFILSYFFYLEYYVPDKESKIIATRFRVLDQIGDNINAKIRSYESNVQSLEPTLKDSVKSKKTFLEGHGYYFSDEELIPFILDKIISEDYLGKSLNRDLQIIDFKLDYSNVDSSTQASVQKDKELKRTEPDTYYYFDPLCVQTRSEVGG